MVSLGTLEPVNLHGFALNIVQMTEMAMTAAALVFSSLVLRSSSLWASWLFSQKTEIEPGFDGWKVL